MSLSRKSVYGAVIGGIIAVGLILAGMYAIGVFASTGTLQISITDPPSWSQGVTGVTIQYASIDVHIAQSGNQTGWYPVTSSGSINLANVLNVTKVLGSAKLPPGKYNLIRFNITSATITDSSGSHQATLSNGMLQIAIVNGGVQIKSGQTSSVVIDVTSKVTGNTQSGYMLVPSATALPTSSS